MTLAVNGAYLNASGGSVADLSGVGPTAPVPLEGVSVVSWPM